MIQDWQKGELPCDTLMERYVFWDDIYTLTPKENFQMIETLTKCLVRNAERQEEGELRAMWHLFHLIQNCMPATAHHIWHRCDAPDIDMTNGKFEEVEPS